MMKQEEHERLTRFGATMYLDPPAPILLWIIVVIYLIVIVPWTNRKLK